MDKNRRRIRMAGTIFIAFLCATLSFLWPQWREELQANYGYYGTPGQLSDFTGSKVLVSGVNPVGIGKTQPTRYVYKIILDANFDKTKNVADEVPSLFRVVDVHGTCGRARHFTDKKSKVTDIIWNLGKCDNSTSQSLTVAVKTRRKPGGPEKAPLFKPKSCGPVYLNDGALLINRATFKAKSEPSNSLLVAACLNESDIIGCVDKDHDGWTPDCGDCDDSDASVKPGAGEVCEDGIDNDCNGQIYEGC